MQTSLDSHDKATRRRIRIYRTDVNRYAVEDAYSHVRRDGLSLDFIAERYPELSLRDVASLRRTDPNPTL